MDLQKLLKEKKYTKIIVEANRYCETGDVTNAVKFAKALDQRVISSSIVDLVLFTEHEMTPLFTEEEGVKSINRTFVSFHTKAVLKKDPGNFAALVVYGQAALLSAESKHEAPKAFEAALKVKPDSLSTYYKLIAFYEAEGCFEKLKKPYEAVLSLESDIVKWILTVDKIVKQAEVNPVFNIFELLSPYTEESKCTCEKRHKYICKLISRAALEAKPLPAAYLPQILQAWKIYSSTLDFYDKPIFIKSILEVLYKECQWEVLIDFVKTIAATSYELLPKILLINILARLSYERPNEISGLFNSAARGILKLCNVLRHREHNARVVLTEFLMAQGDFVFARDKILPISDLACTDILRLNRSLIPLLDYEMVVQNSMTLVKNPQFSDVSNKAECLKHLIHVTSRINDTDFLKLSCKFGLKLLHKDGESLEVLMNLAYAAIGLGYYKEAVSLIAHIKKKYDQVPELCLLYAMSKPVHLAVALLEILPVSQYSLLYLALLYAKLGFHERAHRIFYQALLLGNSCPVAFDWLAEKFSLEKKWDRVWAAREVSYVCNPRRWPVIKSLADFKINMGYKEEAIEFLEEIRTVSFTKYWKISELSSLEAGLLRLSSQGTDYEKAAGDFNHCIKCNPRVRHYHLYIARSLIGYGLLSAASIHYQILCQEEKSTLFPFNMVARIQKMKQRYGEYHSVSQKIVASGAWRSITALYNWADSCVSLAKLLIPRGKAFKAKQYLQQSADVCSRALRMNKSFVSFWKLFGDTLVLYAVHCGHFYGLNLPSWLFGVEGCSKIRASPLMSLEAAISCYKIGLKYAQEKWTHVFYHDIAVVLMHLSMRHIPPKRDSLMRQAFAYSLKALAICKGSRNCLNTVGVISGSKEVKKYALSEWALTKSADIWNFSIVGFTNLGTLYLCTDQFRKAFEMYMRARNISTSYRLPWIGQIMIDINTGEPLGYYKWKQVCTFLACKKKYSKFYSSIKVDISEKEFKTVFLDDSVQGLITYYGYDESPLSLISQGVALEKFGDMEVAKCLYQKAFEALVRSPVRHKAEVVQLVLYHMARRYPLNLETTVQSIMHFLGSDNLYCKLLRAFLHKESNELLAACEVLKSLKSNKVDGEYGSLVNFSILAVLNKTGNWPSMQNFLVHCMSKRRSEGDLIMAFSYALMYKDPAVFEVLENLSQHEDFKDTHIFHLIKAYRHSDFGQCWCKVLTALQNLPIENLDCKCRYVVLWARFAISYLLHPTSPTTLTLLRALLQSRWFPTNLKEEILIGSILGLHLGDPKFCIKAVHMYPHELPLWTIMIKATSKYKKSNKPNRFINAFRRCFAGPQLEASRIEKVV